MNILNALFFLAILVYRYDFTPWSPYTSSPQDHGYIEMRYESGEMPLLDAIYDFQVTGRARDIPGVPNIAAITFTLAQATSFALDPIKWDQKQILWSNWGFISPHLNLDFPLPDFGQHYAMTSFNAEEILTTWPFDLAFDTQPRSYGDWKFTRSREVPEAGGTLLYLGLGLIVLWTTCRTLAIDARRVL